ncbi:hypothetical protein SHKM778_90590 [Streptomyces sp. KM77-8]|uniref:Pentapeptide repeat-containing protein n=1 Tax=Streptomyces haneummycinicus TaxID=3074435 RepID=A0AAT9HZ01_9ACTN
MDQVVVAGAVAGPGLHHAVGEGAQLGGQLLLGEAFVGARVDVPDEDAGGEFDGGRDGGGGRAREDLDLDVDRGEALREFDDVDVHAARVAGARLVEREVCTESIATRRGLRCSRSRAGAAGERRPSLAMYWLTWRSSSLRA